MWRETKLTKMESVQAFAPHFVNNDSIMAEIINSTEHALTRYYFGHGLLLLYEFHLKSRHTSYHGCLFG